MRISSSTASRRTWANDTPLENLSSTCELELHVPCGDTESLDFAFDHDRVLHVRSISHWAPVCIGPYSQANTLGPGNALCLVAGQIGLIPASMVLPPRTGTDATSPLANEGQAQTQAQLGVESSSRESRSFHGVEMALCVKNASAVASALGASLSRGCVFATLYVSRGAALAAGAAAVAEAARIATPLRSAETRALENGSAVLPLAAPGDGRNAYSGATKPEDWLEGMVEECQDLVEEGFAEERAEAIAAAAGTGARVEGDEEAEDSGEEGWTSDPEELAKEAARKKVVLRRVPIMPVVVPSLPKNAAVELEVLCVSRAAGLLLPYKAYFASTPPMRIPTGRRCYAGSPVPLHLLPRRLHDPASSNAMTAKAGEGEGAVDLNGTNMVVHREHDRDRSTNPVPEINGTRGRFGVGSTAVVSVQTSGSTVDRVLCVVRSSLQIEVDAALGAQSDSRTEGIVLSERTDCDGEYSIRGEEEQTRAHPPLSATQFEQALRTLLEKGTSAALSSARLRWQDVSSLRVYYLSPEVTGLEQEELMLPGDLGGDNDSEQGCVDAELIEHTMFLALSAVTLERPAVTFVPVEALSSGSRVCVHATAWSLDRLKTELWVRGAS